MNWRTGIAVLLIVAFAESACKRRAAPAPAPAAPVAATSPPPPPAVETMDETTLAAYAERGRLYWSMKGCNACHSLNGSRGIGGSAAAIWGTKLKQSDHSEVEVDAAFIRESIFDPSRNVTAGFPNQMQNFTGRMTEDELTCITALYRFLKDGPEGPQRR